MPDDKSGAETFILQCVSAGEGAQQVWRVRLETIGSGETHGFASLEEALDFIERQLADRSPT